MEKAQKANTSEPNDWIHLNTLGVAQYRVGDYEEALETLTHSDKIHIELNQSSSPLNLAFITMSLHQLGRVDKAVEAAQKGCELTKWKDHTFVNILAEAYFVTEDFASAEKWQTEAIDLLSEEQKATLLRNYEARLKLYRSGSIQRKGLSEGSLIAWWKLDETQNGNVIDSSGNGLNGKLIGDAKIVTDPERGNVLSLDGTGDYVDFGDNPKFDIIDSITLSCWIKINEFDTNYQAIVTKGDTAWMLQRAVSSNFLQFACRGTTTSDPNGGIYGSIIGKTNVNDGFWHYIAGVYNGSKTYLYIDGILDNSEDAAGFITTNQFSVLIGNNAEYIGRCWEGLIDDVRIYNCALSEAEIKELYAGGEL